MLASGGEKNSVHQSQVLQYCIKRYCRRASGANPTRPDVDLLSPAELRFWKNSEFLPRGKMLLLDASYFFPVQVETLKLPILVSQLTWVPV